MAIRANGNIDLITNVVVNGVAVSTVIANGVTVLQPALPTTSTPSITNVNALSDGFGATVTWRVRNNDSSTATIFSNVTTNPPTTNRGSRTPNQSTSNISQSDAPNPGVIYARAQASGKNMSAVTSVSYEASGGGCYLTSSMVDYFGYEDDGEELNSMRTIRSYMYKTKNPEHITMLRDYAKESREIIKYINTQKNSNLYYEEIKDIVLHVVSLIKEDKVEEAMNYY